MALFADTACCTFEASPVAASTFFQTAMDALVEEVPAGVCRLIIVCGWVENMHCLLVPLRASHLTELQPVVIIDPVVPDERAWRLVGSFRHVYFVQGSPLHESTLLRAGIERAHSLVVLNRDVVTDRGDADTVMMMLGVERTFPHVRVLAEMVNPSMIKLVPPIVPRDHVLRSDFILLPSFASGKVLCETVLETLIGREYHLPDVIVIMDMLLTGRMPTVPGVAPSFLYLVPAPVGWVGLTWRAYVLASMLETCTIPLGLLRARGTLDSPCDYVYTAPSSQTQLLRTDYVYLLRQKRDKIPPPPPPPVRGAGNY